MRWIIENITKEPSYLALAATLKDKGRDPLELNGDFVLSLLDGVKSERVALFGSIEMVRMLNPLLMKNLNFIVNTNSAEKYKCTEYYPYFTDLLFNDKYVIAPLGYFLERPSFFFDILGSDGCLFVRPDTGEKSFKGTLLKREDMDVFNAQAPDDKAELIIVSSPKKIKSEWRFVVSDKKQIVTQSSYKIGNKRERTQAAPPEAFVFVNKVLQRGYFPDKLFCVDIAEDCDGNFWLLELTSLNSAGLYACDMEKIVEAVEKL